MLSLDNVSYQYKDKKVFASLNIDFSEGMTYIVTGKSESGKSLFLKIAAGLIQPTSGDVVLEGKRVFQQEIDRVIRRKIGFVFQEGVLVSNLSIEENLLLPIKHIYPEKREKDIILRAIELIRRFKLELSLLDKRPSEISYTKKKLINFIRALLAEPEILLIDEPFFNLTAAQRKLIMKELIRLKDEGKTLIISSTNTKLAKELADVVIFLKEGSAQSFGSTEAFFESDNLYVRNFVVNDMGE